MHEDAHLDMECEDRLTHAELLMEYAAEEDHIRDLELEAQEEAWEAGRDETLADYEAEMEAQRAEIEAEMLMAQYDDDPSPYDGTYSEC